MVFHFNPRFDEDRVCRNTTKNGQWGPEERSRGTGSLHVDSRFEISFLVLTDRYQVKLFYLHSIFILFYFISFLFYQVRHLPSDSRYTTLLKYWFKLSHLFYLFILFLSDSNQQVPLCRIQTQTSSFNCQYCNGYRRRSARLYLCSTNVRCHEIIQYRMHATLTFTARCYTGTETILIVEHETILIVEHEAGEIIRFVVSVCLSVSVLMLEPLTVDLRLWFVARGSTLTLASLGL